VQESKGNNKFANSLLDAIIQDSSKRERNNADSTKRNI